MKVVRDSTGVLGVEEIIDDGTDYSFKRGVEESTTFKEVTQYDIEDSDMARADFTSKVVDNGEPLPGLPAGYRAYPKSSKI